MPNIIRGFLDVKKGGYYMLSPVKALHYGLGQPKEVIISRLSGLSGFSNIRRVADFHAVGIYPSCMEEVKSLAK